MQSQFKPNNAPNVRIETEAADGRIFIAVGGLQIDIHCGEEGVAVQLQHQNDVLDECHADYPDLVNGAGA